MLAWWLLVASLSAPVGLAQFRPGDYRAESDQDRSEIEYQRSRQQQAAYELRRALAHARLGAAASTIEPQTLCPATVSPGDGNPTFGKRALQPLTPRSALRPTTARWSDVAPASQSAAGIFSEYISEQVVQSRCINCHVVGGVSGHTRLVLSANTVDGHEALNLAVFENLTATVEGATDLILNKIQGVAHGGGIQVPAGSADFANMERFLRLLSGEGTSGTGLSPDSLFEGVTMASPARTLWRAALIFAGRLPTQAELNSVNNGRDSSLRRAIRNLMAGSGFHEFLIRASNDRLLTDRHLEGVIDVEGGEFVKLANKRWELAKSAFDKGLESVWEDPEYSQWEHAADFGFARAPLELIAYVAENDLPYTEILTADYVMANPLAAEAYGAMTEFENPKDPLEFRPSNIAVYYRNDDSKVTEYDLDLGTRVINPGNLATDYPHVGILNTNAFLRRYPTTATNRNRARSRWTYYHFLGLDIEKSAARTTDPDALADTDNPTMKNPACTVCHQVLDPVAGAYQAYGDEGLYKHKHGGLDSLPDLYKHPEDGSVSPYQEGDTWFRDMREPGFGGTLAPSADNSLQWLAEQIVADDRFAEATVRFWWPAIMGVKVSDPPEDESDSDFEALLLSSTAQSMEVKRLAQGFRSGIAGGKPFNLKDLLSEIALSAWFRAESVTGLDPVRAVALRNAGLERLLTPEELDAKTGAVSGYRWGRRFLLPFGARRPRTNLNDYRQCCRIGYGLLYGGIDSDGITERSGDMTPLMAAVAQRHAADVSCPVVFREFFLWPDEKRMLFAGIDPSKSLSSEARDTFPIVAESSDAQQAVSLSADLSAGSKTVRLSFTNPYHSGPGRDNHRTIWLDRLVLRDADEEFEQTIELESFYVAENCSHWEGSGYFWMRTGCSLSVPVQLPTDGTYFIDVEAYAWNPGDELARLEISVELDGPTSRSEMAIRRKLVELHWKLFGVSASVDSPDIEESYSLFLEVWKQKRGTEGQDFNDSQFDCKPWQDHQFYEGVIHDVLEYANWGGSGLDWDRIREFRSGIDTSDPNHVVRAWVVTLAYLLTDSRYLYL